MAIEVLLAIIFTPSLAHCDVFASIGEFRAHICEVAGCFKNSVLVAVTGHMTDLLLTEKDLVTSLKDYIRAEENKLAQIKQ